MLGQLLPAWGATRPSLSYSKAKGVADMLFWDLGLRLKRVILSRLKLLWSQK